MGTIFDAKFDTSSVNGEFFWHATTIENIFKMIKYDKDGLKAIGTGQLGAGFYVTGTRSDYQKGMARRGRGETTLDVPLFLLYVHVQNFYSQKAAFLDAWSTANSGEDFAAVCWYEHGLGGVNQPERGGFIPPVDKVGGRVDFKYGQYRGETIADMELAKKKPKEKIDFMEMLWYYASRNQRPKLEDVKDYGPYGLQLAIMGARTILKRSLLELAFKSVNSLSSAAIVGAKLFSPTAAPLTLQFDIGSKSYDFRSAIIEPKDLLHDDNPLNFRDEVWVDLDELLKILRA